MLYSCFFIILISATFLPVSISEEAAKRGSEKTRGQYGAVDFSYDSSALGDVVDDTNIDKDGKIDDREVPPEDPYICPSELQGHDLLLPETDKQAQIIERTAVFVARQGNQMEIVLKAKQTDNPLFGFLNYDHDLNPFYKLMVKLIRQGRYVPKIRPAKCENPSTDQCEPNKSIHEDDYELKLPKVDISNTAYASLIEKFKKFNEIALNLQQSASAETNQTVPEAEEANTAQETQGDVAQSGSKSVDSKESALSTGNSVEIPNEANPGADSVSMEEYEQCYQEYYKHYYAHYYSQFSEQQLNAAPQTGALTSEQQTDIVNQAAKAAAVAASAAVNAMHQARTKKNTTVESIPQSFPAMTAGEKAIIDKMAEYVTRNGPEFEELVVCQKKNDPRFGFLNPGHSFHEYYLSRRKHLDPTFCGALHSNVSFEQNPNQSAEVQSVDHHSEESPSTTVDSTSPLASPVNDETRNSHSANSLPADRFSSISFRVTRPSASKLRPSNADPNTISCTRSPDAVHDEMNVDLKPVSSCPVLRATHSPQLSPINVPSMTLAEQQCNNGNKSRRRRSSSPVRFSLPGIACAYSSDSSAPSSPDHSPVRTSPAPSSKPITRSAPPASDTSSPTVHSVSSLAAPQLPKNQHRPSPTPSPPSPVMSSANKTSNKTSGAGAPTVKSSDAKNGPINAPIAQSTSLGEASIEEMLDNAHRRSTVSHFASSRSSSSQPAADDEQLQLNRRKRAALLVARLKQTTTKSPTPRSPVEDATPAAPQKQLLPPPPAPDSVPAAVAHAVVASLKRRHEASLSTAEKERKRHRSPPAAYALPRSSKSSEHESSRDRRDSGYYRQKKLSRY